MFVYRIALAKYASNLVASGQAARWNSKGKFVIYTAASRALACLENVVHRSGEGLSNAFNLMEIEIPDDLAIEQIEGKHLKENWNDFLEYSYCQALGDQWLTSGKTAILSVPSAIVSAENNYLINPQHADFQRITLKKSTPFVFDSRIKNQ